MKIILAAAGIIAIITISKKSEANVFISGCVSVQDNDFTKIFNSCKKRVIVCWRDQNNCARGCSELVGVQNDTIITKWKGAVDWNWITEEDFDYKNKKCVP
ncbi:hypothetical protein [Methylocella sp.]|uniref:hypothetical protein n=1 Tax=Methylocella sp. TaxID=1978226 RepID=UPI003784D8F9